jgi:hypothetical protein
MSGSRKEAHRDEDGAERCGGQRASHVEMRDGSEYWPAAVAVLAVVGHEKLAKWNGI